MKNIVVFASGSGSNFQSLIEATLTGQIPGVITGLITDRKNIQAIDRAKKHNIPVEILNPSSFDNEETYSTTLLKTLSRFNTDLIVLAGYLKKIPNSIISIYQNRILNIHPSLLPKYGGKGFYGKRVHQAVIENNEAESGCTVHLVTEIYDDGPVLGQSKIMLAEDETADSLAKKILALEHKLYPQVISDFLKTNV
ncbi:MAG: phosphoribosylglycinamide formyltransferase [Balneolaceae bacterium]|nr:phosphoribosylglycinamide formyltransferase [Balneolaceae bacterium]